MSTREVSALVNEKGETFVEGNAFGGKTRETRHRWTCALEVDRGEAMTGEVVKRAWTLSLA
jgi:hypothetical protein